MKNDADVSLRQGMAVIPPELLQAHRPVPQRLVDALPKQKILVVR